MERVTTNAAGEVVKTEQIEPETIFAPGVIDIRAAEAGAIALAQAKDAGKTPEEQVAAMNAAADEVLKRPEASGQGPEVSAAPAKSDEQIAAEWEKAYWRACILANRGDVDAMDRTDLRDAAAVVGVPVCGMERFKLRVMAAQ